MDYFRNRFLGSSRKTQMNYERAARKATADQKQV